MNKEISSRIMRLIDDYVNGKLNRGEEELLWAEMLQHPEYFPLFKTQANLKKRHLDNKRKTNRHGVVLSIIQDKRSWVFALSAVILITLLINLYRNQVALQEPYYLEKIEMLHLISPEVNRSSTGQLTTIEQHLQNTFLLAVSGEEEKALGEYQELLKEKSHQDSINYNLAILYFNMDDYHASASAFRQVNCSFFGEDPRLVESCLWFKTKSYLANQNPEKAADSARRILELEGPRREDAYEVLKMIQNQHF